MKLPVYPKYKPSGVEWVGDVPEQWMWSSASYRGRYGADELPQIPPSERGQPCPRETGGEQRADKAVRAPHRGAR